MLTATFFFTGAVEVNRQIMIPKYHIAAIPESIAKEGEYRTRKPEHYYDSPHPP
jgi:hypothetical protein